MTKLSKKESSLNEEDSLQDMLDTEKMLMNFYNLAIIEGSTKSLRSTFVKNMSSAQEDQFAVFNEMNSRGYYEVMPAQKNIIDQKIDTFKKTLSELKAN